MSNEVGKQIRHNCRVPTNLLIRRIEEGLAAQKLSERKACLTAGVGIKAIAHIRKGHAPKAKTLQALAGTLGVPAEYLLDAAADISGDQGLGKLQRVFVVGAVQAGAWKPALQWNQEDWKSITVPADDRFPGVPRYALKVNGPSMNRLYPDGTIVIVVSFGDLARLPQTGERVVVMRRSPDADDFEATIKEYQVDERGRHILWPRSDDPEFQAPFIYAEGDLPTTFGPIMLPGSVMAGALPEIPAGAGDLMVSALVIASYRNE